MKLQKQSDMLSPTELKREITRLQNELYHMNRVRQNQDQKIVLSNKAHINFEYIST